MIRISPSAIGALMSCPRCLWLYANESIKRPFGIFPSLPSGMDELFKNYFDTYRKEGKLPPEIDGKVKAKLYNKMENLKLWREIDYGKGGLSAKFEDMEIVVRGAIDELLVNDNGEFIILDFKTRGYPTKEDSHEHYQHQLDLYALLFEENGYKVDKFGYLLFFWPKDYSLGLAKFDTELVKMSVSAKNGFKLLQDVHKIINGKIPDAHSECEYCVYRKIGDSFEE